MLTGEKEVAVRQCVSLVSWDPASHKACDWQPRSVSSRQRRCIPGNTYCQLLLGWSFDYLSYLTALFN